MAKRTEVYDFLYVDVPRIKSLISQLHDLGILLEQVETDELHSSKSGTGSAKAGTSGVAKALGLDAQATVQGGASRSSKGTQQRKYDPQFALPLDLLDLLTDEDLIKRKLEDFGYGAIADFEGKCFAIDFSAMNDSWDSLLKSADSNMDANTAAGMAQMLKIMTPSVQAVFHSSHGKVWANLLKENWLIPPSSIMLSHGARIHGDLRILGIVDAQPDRPKGQVGNYTPETLLAAPYEFMMNMFRAIIGRPADCYSFLPLIVYRCVTRKH